MFASSVFRGFADCIHPAILAPARELPFGTAVTGTARRQDRSRGMEGSLLGLQPGAQGAFLGGELADGFICLDSVRDVRHPLHLIVQHFPSISGSSRLRV